MTQHKFQFGTGKSRASEKRQRWDEVQQMVIAACDKFGGHAQLGEHHAVIDTRKYKVVAK